MPDNTMENYYETSKNYAVVRGFPNQPTEVVGFYSSFQEADAAARDSACNTPVDIVNTGCFYEAIRVS